MNAKGQVAGPAKRPTLTSIVVVPFSFASCFWKSLGITAGVYEEFVFKQCNENERHSFYHSSDASRSFTSIFQRGSTGYHLTMLTTYITPWPDSQFQQFLSVSPISRGMRRLTWAPASYVESVGKVAWCRECTVR